MSESQEDMGVDPKDTSPEGYSWGQMKSPPVYKNLALLLAGLKRILQERKTEREDGKRFYLHKRKS